MGILSSEETLHKGFKSREGRVKRKKLWVEERRLERSWVTCKNPSLLSQTDRLAPVEYVMLAPRPDRTYIDDSSPKEKDVNPGIYRQDSSGFCWPAAGQNCLYLTF